MECLTVLKLIMLSRNDFASLAACYTCSPVFDGQSGEVSKQPMPVPAEEFERFSLYADSNLSLGGDEEQRRCNADDDDDRELLPIESDFNMLPLDFAPSRRLRDPKTVGPSGEDGPGRLKVRYEVPADAAATLDLPGEAAGSDGTSAGGSSKVVEWVARSFEKKLNLTDEVDGDDDDFGEILKPIRSSEAVFTGSAKQDSHIRQCMSSQDFSRQEIEPYSARLTQT